LRYKPGVEKEFRSSEEFNKVLTVIKSIPSQLHLCYSTIPGAGFGICAAENIPSGTWIGPYEGKRISIEEIGSMLDTRYVWEVSDLNKCKNQITRSIGIILDRVYPVSNEISFNKVAMSSLS
jgi:hypothetical protein